MAAALVILTGGMVAVNLSLDSSLPALAGLVGYFVLIAALRPLTRGVAESTDAQLDERDRELRDHVGRRAYPIVSGALVLLTIYATVTQGIRTSGRAWSAC
ncbi:MAG: hypothetical protein M3Z25_12875 [Actinomycetota bacterium]|nr:hypothetical protein [Actinomycetota bacterium]